MLIGPQNIPTKFEANSLKNLRGETYISGDTIIILLIQVQARLLKEQDFWCGKNQLAALVLESKKIKSLNFEGWKPPALLNSNINTYKCTQYFAACTQEQISALYVFCFTCTGNLHGTYLQSYFIVMGYGGSKNQISLFWIISLRCTRCKIPHDKYFSLPELWFFEITIYL